MSEMKAIRRPSGDQRAPRDPEQLGRLGLVAAALGERLHDALALHAFELLHQVRTCIRGFGAGAGRDPWRGAQGGWQMRGQQRRPVAEQHRALDHVAQLADVAWPAVRL